MRSFAEDLALNRATFAHTTVSTRIVSAAPANLRRKIMLTGLVGARRRTGCLRCFRIPRFVLLQIPIEKVRLSLVSAHPIPMQQQVMNLIRENELLDRHSTLRPQSRDQVHRLRKVDIPIVIAVNE